MEEREWEETKDNGEPIAIRPGGKGVGEEERVGGEADKSQTGWTTKPFICLRFICIRAEGTRTRRLRLPTCRGTRHANQQRPARINAKSPRHCFSPFYRRQPTRCLI